MKPAMLDRFMSYVSPEPNTGCWLWTGSCNPDGYGMFWMGSRRLDGSMRSAHRASYEMAIGPIPDGLQLDHLCRTRCCVNPAHMEPVTPKENMLRGNTVNAANSVKTHCNNGHPLWGDNLRMERTSHGLARRCRECERTRQRISREAKGWERK